MLSADFRSNQPGGVRKFAFLYISIELNDVSKITYVAGFTVSGTVTLSRVLNTMSESYVPYLYAVYYGLTPLSYALLDMFLRDMQSY